jgi:hypothetical protein
MQQSEIIFLVEGSPEGGYEALPLGEAIFTQADSMEELRTMVQDAVRCHFDEGERPRLIRATCGKGRGSASPLHTILTPLVLAP